MSNQSAVEKYTFQDFSATSMLSDKDVQVYELKELTQNTTARRIEMSKIIKVERQHAAEQGFTLSPLVSKFRGIDAQELEEKEARIKTEVDEQFSVVKDQGFKSGYDAGFEKGREEVYSQMRETASEQLSLLSDMITRVLNVEAQLLLNQKTQVYQLICNLSKWVCLKEVSQDDKYVERLLEKIINELQTKDNLLIQVSKDHFEKMPGVVEILQEKLGKFTNVRIEVDYKINDKGIIVETANSLIDGTLEQQLKGIDKLFEAVGLEKVTNET
jgi:flagellar assembly protein FliH